MSEASTSKSKVVAGILAVFPPTGALGIHRFYLGNILLGCMHIAFLLVGLLLALTGCLAVLGLPLVIGNLIWAIIEGIMIFVGGISKDSADNPLV